MVEKTDFPIDIAAHVLPLLELCRYASMSSSAVTGLYDRANVDDGFKQRMSHAAPYLIEMADSRPGDMVAATLYVAMVLIEKYESQPVGGRI